MFISVISIIQERLPCSTYVFRQKKLFKTAEFLRNQKLLVNQNRSPTDDDDSLVAKAEEMCLSPLRALPNPKMLQGWQPKVQQSLFKPETLPSTMSASSSSIRRSSQQADFKIKKKVGVNDNARS